MVLYYWLVKLNMHKDMWTNYSGCCNNLESLPRAVEDSQMRTGDTETELEDVVVEVEPVADMEIVIEAVADMEVVVEAVAVAVVVAAAAVAEPEPVPREQHNH